MEALEEAGIERSEIIKAATSRAAKMLKIDDTVGSIEVGKNADLILLTKSPLVSTKAFRSVKYTIKGGIAKTPDEWMQHE